MNNWLEILRQKITKMYDGPELSETKQEWDSITTAMRHSRWDGQIVDEIALAIAAEELSVGLGRMGYTVVYNEKEADMTIGLSMDTLRSDVLGGWTSDKATLVIHDGQTKELLMTIQAKGQFIRPKVPRLVGYLLDEVKERRK